MADIVALQALLSSHAALWQIDNDLWTIYSNLEDLEVIRARPALRVQIGNLMKGWGADGEKILEPRYFCSVEKIEAEYQLWASNMLIRKDDAERLAKGEERRIAKTAEKVAEFHAIEAERKRIEDECGYTKARNDAFEASNNVRALEQDILAFVPDDFDTARRLASWVAEHYASNIGYVDDDEDNLLAVLRSIGGISE